MALTDIMNSVMEALGLNTIFFWVNKFGALLAAWYFGGRLSNKFKSKFSASKLLVLRIVSGVVIYFLGISFAINYLSFLPPIISDYAGALIVFFVFYFFVSMITSNVAFKVVMRKEFEDLVEKVDKISAMVNRLVEATTDKKIMREKLNAKSAETALKTVMKEEKRIEDFVVLDSGKDKDFIFFNVKCRIRSFKVILDAYTGKLVSVNHLRDTPKNIVLSVLSYFYENKTATLGFAFLLVFVCYLWNVRGPVFDERVGELFSFEAPESNSSFSMQDVFGELGFIPGGEQVSQEDLQEYLSQIS